METIYPLGCARWSIDEVENCLPELQGILLGVRHAPHKTKLGFKKTELSSRLGPRYRHVAAFRNVTYREGTITLADPERGLRIVSRLDAPPVLMCGCRRPDSCH